MQFETEDTPSNLESFHFRPGCGRTGVCRKETSRRGLDLLSFRSERDYRTECKEQEQNELFYAENHARLAEIPRTFQDRLDLHSRDAIGVSRPLAHRTMALRKNHSQLIRLTISTRGHLFKVGVKRTHIPPSLVTKTFTKPRITLRIVLDCATITALKRKCLRSALTVMPSRPTLETTR